MTSQTDLTGRRFGLLTVLARAPNTSYGTLAWLCKCDCGETRVAASHNLRYGHTRSCGHLKGLNRRPANNQMHGGSHSLTYRSWQSMKDRCHNPRSYNYARYGARGIMVCERWRHSFTAFLADMGERPSPEITLDRIDGDVGYLPGNCRWAAVEVQSENRSCHLRFTFGGRTLTLRGWANEAGISKSCLRGRLKLGWSFEKAITTPVRKSVSRT